MKNQRHERKKPGRRHTTTKENVSLLPFIMSTPFQSSSPLSSFNRSSLCDEPENETQGISPDHHHHNNNHNDWLRRWLSRIRQWIRHDKRLAWMACLVAMAVVAAAKTSKGPLRLPQQWFRQTRNRQSLNHHRSAIEAPLSHLWETLQQRMIQQVLLSSSSGASSIVYYKMGNQDQTNTTSNTGGRWRKTRLPSHQPQMLKDLLQQLQQTGCADVQVLPESWLSQGASIFVMAIPFLYLAILFRMIQHFSNQHSSLSSSSSTDATSPNGTITTGTTFADVAGLDDTVVPDLQEIVQYLQNPRAFTALGAHPPRGILLHGPPGCGKTLLARAVASEATVDAFVACSASDFVEVYVGRGAARVRHLFQQVRAQAVAHHRRRNRPSIWSSWWPWPIPWFSSASGSRSDPGHDNMGRPPTAILFIDELDALAKTRSVMAASDEREQTLMQLLTEMDGFVHHDQNSKTTATTSNDNVTVVVLAATNRPDVLDPAMLRRLDRQIHVGYPDATGRRAILQHHARDIRLAPSGIDWDALVDATTSSSSSDNTTAERGAAWSGSDLRNVVNEAALLAVRSGSTAVEQLHFEQAIEKYTHSRAFSQTSSSLFARMSPFI